MTAPTLDRTEAARSAVAANAHWYHSIDLAPGVTTPGKVDLRATARRLLPADLSGARALDVGTFDGFWAFELERRGADVVAIDVERIDDAQWPPVRREELRRRAEEWDVELGRGFRLAAGALGSRVERVVCDVGDLEPDRVGGPVDLAFCGALLLHLRDPVGGLERLHATVRPGGRLLLLESPAVRESLLAPRRPLARYEPLAHAFNWWRPNVAALRAWLLTAGFVDVRTRGAHRPPADADMRQWYVGLEARRP